MSASRPHPDLRLLLDHLADAGWGRLAGRAMRGRRTVLEVLVRQLGPLPGEGTTSVTQVALWAAYTVRHTRTCLKHLEQMGLVEWRRGGWRGEQHKQGWMRVDSGTLIEFVTAAEAAQRPGLARTCKVEDDGDRP